MAAPLVISLNGHADIEKALVSTLGAMPAQWAQKQFPDGESGMRILSPVKDADLVIVCGLEHPDPRLLPLVFLAETARELGVRRIGLVAPYLAYMRQDKRFQSGEAVTSRIFAALLSRHVDFLVTVDPHLHRYHSLDEIYAVPSRVLHAAPLMADFVRRQPDCFLVGPDEESAQWVESLASQAGVPWVVGSKQRFGDRQVQVTLPDLSSLSGREPVLMDDVISSGMTMARTLEALAIQGFTASTCLGVHGLFAERADSMLEGLGATLVTSNTIVHGSNQLDVGPLVAQAVAELLE